MEGEELQLGTHETLRVTSETPEVFAVEGTWAAGGAAPPTHLHPAQAERFEFLSGRMTAVVAGEKRAYGAGDVLEIPPGTPHRMWNADSERVLARWQTSPAGRTAEWFRAIDRLQRGRAGRPPLPALAGVLAGYPDVFRLAVGPRRVWPVLGVLLRLLARAGR